MSVCNPFVWPIEDVLTLVPSLPTGIDCIVWRPHTSARGTFMSPPLLAIGMSRFERVLLEGAA